MAGRKEVRKMVIAIVTEANTTTSHANQWGSSVRLERAFRMIWREMSFTLAVHHFVLRTMWYLCKITLLTISDVYIDAVCCR